MNCRVDGKKAHAKYLKYFNLNRRDYYHILKRSTVNVCSIELKIYFNLCEVQKKIIEILFNFSTFNLTLNP